MDLTILQQSNLPDKIKNVQIVDMRGKYPVNPNYTWEQLKGVRKLDDLSCIVFHHDAISKGQTLQYTDSVLLSRIATAHINSKKNIPKGDNFPYHAWIRNGNIYVANNITDFTYGVASNNGYTVHICVAGNYAGPDTLSEQDRNALYAAFFLYKENMPNYNRLAGHKELSPTACPGYDMGRVKKDLEAIQLSSALTNTPNDNMSKVYSTKTRIDDLYKTATGSTKYNELAQKYLLKVNEFMKGEGIL